MRPDPQPHLSLANRLYDLSRERPLPWRRSAVVRGITECLAEIAATCDWRIVPLIASLALDRRKEVAESTATTIATLLQRTRVLDLPPLDRCFRERSPYLHAEYVGWAGAKPADVERLARLGAAASLLQLATCHPSGYVREAAVRRLAVASDGQEVPFLLLRVNDWVAPVRKAAVTALWARLNAEGAASLVSALPLVDVTKRWRRIDDADVLAEIDEVLRRPTAAPALQDGFMSEDRHQRRACLRRAVQNPAIDPSVIYRTALADSDAVTRLWAARQLCDGPDAQFDEFAARLLRDPLGIIRLRALRCAAGTKRELQPDGFLCDQHAGVRHEAQQRLAKSIDVPGRYRTLITTEQGSRLAASILGLAETDGRDDLVTIRTFVTHKQPQVRRAALHALFRLESPEIVELCLSALLDPSPSVTREACTIGIGLGGRLPSERVWNCFETATTEHGKRHALRVLIEKDYWQRLPYLLLATATEMASVQAAAQAAVTSWIGRANRTFTVPSPPDMSMIGSALSSARIPERNAADVRAIMNSRTRRA